MSYFTKTIGGLVRHWTREGRQFETIVRTKTLACDRCGWTVLAVDNDSWVLNRCICGGTLRLTVAIKEANKVK